MKLKEGVCHDTRGLMHGPAYSCLDTLMKTGS
jgi:hypothetical protein